MKDPAVVVQRVFTALEAKLGKCIPVQRYVAAGEVAYDCDSFVVAASEVYSGFPGSRQIAPPKGVVVFSTDVRVYVIRTVGAMDRSGQRVNYKQLEKVSKQSLADAGKLTEALFAAVGDETLADLCDDVVFGGVVIDGPEGDAIATVLTISLQL